MRSSLVRLFCCIVLSTGLTALVFPESSQGQSLQPVLVRPTELYRFTISSSDGGYLLTGNWAEGLAWGFTPDLIPVRGSRTSNLGIYVPPSGYTPDPTSGLVALHRWLVVQDGWRNYFYYSLYYSASLGSDYHYHGIQGYVFPPGQTTFRGIPLSQLSSFYSQSYGYWNGGGALPEDVGFFIEQPPHESFEYHGKVCAMPGALVGTRFPPPLGLPAPLISDVIFFPPAPPPPPPGSCMAGPGIKGKCAQLGGWWDDETCSCQY